MEEPVIRHQKAVRRNSSGHSKFTNSVCSMTAIYEDSVAKINAFEHSLHSQRSGSMSSSFSGAPSLCREDSCDAVVNTVDTGRSPAVSTAYWSGDLGPGNNATSSLHNDQKFPSSYVGEEALYVKQHPIYSSCSAGDNLMYSNCPTHLASHTSMGSAATSAWPPQKYVGHAAAAAAAADGPTTEAPDYGWLAAAAAASLLASQLQHTSNHHHTHLHYPDVAQASSSASSSRMHSTMAAAHSTPLPSLQALQVPESCAVTLGPKTGSSELPPLPSGTSAVKSTEYAQSQRVGGSQSQPGSARDIMHSEAAAAAAATYYSSSSSRGHWCTKPYSTTVNAAASNSAVSGPMQELLCTAPIRSQQQQQQQLWQSYCDAHQQQQQTLKLLDHEVRQLLLLGKQLAAACAAAAPGSAAAAACESALAMHDRAMHRAFAAKTALLSEMRSSSSTAVVSCPMAQLQHQALLVSQQQQQQQQQQHEYEAHLALQQQQQQDRPLRHQHPHSHHYKQQQQQQQHLAMHSILVGTVESPHHLYTDDVLQQQQHRQQRAIRSQSGPLGAVAAQDKLHMLLKVHRMQAALKDEIKQLLPMGS